MTHRDSFIDDNGIEHTFSSQETFDYVKMLTKKYGRFNPQSEFSIHDSVRYLLNGQEQIGLILWAIQATTEHVAQYIIAPMGLDRAPDKVAPGNMLGLAFRLTLNSTIGCYYTDERGEPWCTFEAINHAYTCSACGQEISRGYSRGKLGEESYFCGEHVHIEQEQS